MNADDPKQRVGGTQREERANEHDQQTSSMSMSPLPSASMRLNMACSKVSMNSTASTRNRSNNPHNRN